MGKWNYEVQKMIDFIEDHIEESPTLDSVSQLLHYSKFYCSRQFRLAVGMTLKRYVAGRRLYHATIQVRDTTRPIIEIALEYGYSSQGAPDEGFPVCVWMYTSRIQKKSGSDSTSYTKSDSQSFLLCRKRSC